MAELGKVIADKFEIVRLVGEGGMSRVYLAMDKKLNKQWAIKEIKAAHNAEEQELIRESLVTEANMMKQLDHPALPRITDLLNEDGTLFVVMDYIEGEPLSRIIKDQGAQSQDDVIEWGEQLCDALDYLHTRNPPIIYRDMKPSNVMLKPDGTVKIIDFGIAREYRLEKEQAEEGALRLDDTTMLGTKGYAAPEQFGGLGQTDARTDVYCLGATMYHLLTGQSPAEPPYTMHPIRQVNSAFSPGLEKIITKATQQNPEKRYASCAEMLYELERYNTADDAHRKKLQTKWRAFVGVCVGAALCLGVGFFGLGMNEYDKNQNYDYQIELAEKASEIAEAQEYYLSAVDIIPAETRAYAGLIATYKEDDSFSAQEERQFLNAITPHFSAVQSDDDAYAELAFEVGKLYWYYYDYAADNGDNRMTRIKSASRWMSEAASHESFVSHDLAEVYSGIAEFNTGIVARINEGSDEGSYAPYFENLQRLNDLMAAEHNDVVTLETSALVNDALQAYARKFRADGIEQADMLDLLGQALKNAEAVNPTTEKLDEEQEGILAASDATRESIENAFVDARTIS